MTVVESVQKRLAQIAERAPDLADSPEAATALALAAEMDGHNSATSKSMCARALLETLDKLRELAPPEKERTRLDGIRDSRGLRLVGGSAGKD